VVNRLHNKFKEKKMATMRTIPPNKIRMTSGITTVEVGEITIHTIPVGVEMRTQLHITEEGMPIKIVDSIIPSNSGPIKVLGGIVEWKVKEEIKICMERKWCIHI
jgi:hypothetical protein